MEQIANNRKFLILFENVPFWIVAGKWQIDN